MKFGIRKDNFNMNGGLITRKTINGVVTIGGRPIVSPTGNGYEVLVSGNDGKCKGCAYKRKGINCGCICQYYRFGKDVDGHVKTNELRIKIAKAFDRLVTADGRSFFINETAKFEFKVEETNEVV